MSVGTIALFVNWLLEGGLRHKIKTLVSNKLAVAIISVFIIHLVGLLWTSDFDYAFHDLKVKLPLLIIPIVLGSVEIKQENIKKIFLVFAVATVVSCLISVGVFVQYKLGQKHISNMRDISIFISHIRLSLMAVFSIVGSWYFLIKKEIKAGYVYALTIFLLMFLTLLQSVTGLLLFALFVAFSPVLFFARSRRNILISFSMLSVLIISTYVVSKPFYEWYFVPKETTFFTHTKEGNFYRNNTKSNQLEDGYYVWKHICDKELKWAWNKVSKHPIDSLGNSHQTIKSTLIRYLTGLHLRKDAEGVYMLNAEDIHNIERGIVHRHEYNSVLKRLDEFFFEIAALMSGQNPSDNSFSQRLFSWGLAFQIIKENPIIGTGTGDIKEAYKNSYEKQKIDVWKQIRAHNQFVTFVIAFGILSVFPIAAFLFFTFKNSSYHNKLKFLYVLIVLYSFMFEDTLETQAGVTFVAFFMGLFSSPKLET